VISWPPTEIGIGEIGGYDKVFDLGGHSLMQMKVVYRIESEAS